MANLIVIDGAGNVQELKATGTGTTGDPFIVENRVEFLGDSLPAGENTIGLVGGNQVSLTATPTVSATPDYAAGDNMGGKLTLANAARVSGGSGVIQSLVIGDLAAQSLGIDVIFFNADPSATTFNDNSPLDIDDADIPKIVGHVSIAAADYCALVDNTVATKTGIGLAFKLSGTSLYAALVARGAQNLAAATDITLRVSCLQD